MLVNKDFTKDEVISIKMINGDELIAQFQKESADEIVIRNPVVLTMGSNGAIGMIPWCLLSERKEHPIKKSQTFIIAKTKKDACEQYLENAINMEIRI